MSDQRIELAETGEQFRQIVFEDVNGEEIQDLTTSSPIEYKPVEVISISTLRTLIEILLRELKNIRNFILLFQSLNCVLFELFSTLIGYVLVQWFRQRHPLQGGVPEAIGRFKHGGICICHRTAE